LTSHTEAELIGAISDLMYGEITGVHVPDDERISTEVLVTEKQKALIDAIRDGISTIEKIVVHEGEPMQIEYIQSINGFRCIRKFRL
jgi:hypothetical protein